MVRPHVVARTLRRRILHPLVLLAAAWVLSGCSRSEATSNVTPFVGTWSYRWGDSPRLPNGELAWTRSDDGLAWPSMSSWGTPPGRNQNQFLWMRTQIPNTGNVGPILYVRGVDQIFEAYLDGALVYRFGSFEGPNALRFLGYKSHYLPLGDHAGGKTLTLRIHSTHVNIGLFGETLIGAPMALVTTEVQRDIPKLAMGIVTLSIGVFALVLFLVRRKERGYLQYGLLALAMGVYFTAVSPSRQMIVDAPLGWLYIELFSLYLLGGFLAAYVEEILGAGFLGMVRWLKRAFFVYTGLAAFLVATGLVPILKTLLPNQIMLLVASLVLTTHAVHSAWLGRQNARIFMVGFAAAASAGVYDLLGAIGILSRANLPIGHFGFFVFTVAMGLIWAGRFLEVQDRVRQYSTVLGLSLASARVLEPGQQARVALDELLRLLKANRAFLFLTEPEGTERAGKLELRAVREAVDRPLKDQALSLAGATFRADILERVRLERKPLIVSEASGHRRNAMAAPLLVRNELVGALYLESGENRRPFNEADLAVLLGLGTQLSITIVTTRAVRLEVQTAIQQNRLEKQDALLAAASRMAKGDIETPIVVEENSEWADLGHALDAMRRDVGAKIKMLESKNAEVQVLNDELKRKIEERTMTLLSALLDESARPARPVLSAGSMIGDRYRIVRRLGAGAMGVVYSVERVTDGKTLAIKWLTEVKDKPSMARFIREAHILSRLDHPNLVSIVDVDATASGHLYLVMEYFAGQTLDKFQGKPVGWNLSVLRQIADGLAAVHDRGVVHRDLKPGNVLIAVDDAGQPRVKLVDFGISTLSSDEDAPAAQNEQKISSNPLDDESETLILGQRPVVGSTKIVGSDKFTVTQAGAFMGTPLYMAPELAPSLRAGKPVRPTSDMFSFGVIAYELYTGAQPFALPPIYHLLKHGRLDKPMGLRRIAGLSIGTMGLFERCLAQNPDDRPTAREIAEVIRAELLGGRVSNKPPKTA